MVNKKLFFIFASLLVVMGLVFAAVTAPTGIYFSENSTSAFDEDGSLFLNWTAGGSDEANYSVFISVDGGTSWFNDSLNDSLKGYTFTNTTEANYTFLVQATNDTLDQANSSKISIVVDTTSPKIEYGTGVQTDTSNASQNFIFVNVTATDTYKESLIFSLYNTTGIVNETIFSDSYATLTINWTNLSEGVYYYNVTANDSATNSNHTSTYKITLDTTAPSISFSCTPSSVVAGGTVTCSCSGNDTSGSGVNNTATSYTASISTSSAGSFTETCTITDYAGNSVSDTESYEVTTSSSSSSGNSSSGNTWGKTFVLSGEQFQKGYTQTLKEQERAKLMINNEYHYVGVESIGSNSVDLIITSEPIEVTLSVGEDEKVDVERDGFYDLYLYLVSIDSGEVDLTILSINEEVLEEASIYGLSEEGNESLGTEEGIKKERNFLWLWIVLGVIALLAIGYGVYYFIKNRK